MILAFRTNDYDDSDGDASIWKARTVLRNNGYHDTEKVDHHSSTVIQQIKNGHPVLMRGGRQLIPYKGHMWVCDGLQQGSSYAELKLMCLEDCPPSVEPQRFEEPFQTIINEQYHPNRYHMNWGWGGSYNGFYEDDNLSLPNGRNYHWVRKDLINIYPSITQ